MKTFYEYIYEVIYQLLKTFISADSMLKQAILIIAVLATIIQVYILVYKKIEGKYAKIFSIEFWISLVLLFPIAGAILYWVTEVLCKTVFFRFEFKVSFFIPPVITLLVIVIESFFPQTTFLIKVMKKLGTEHLYFAICFLALSIGIAAATLLLLFIFIKKRKKSHIIEYFQDEGIQKGMSYEDIIKCLDERNNRRKAATTYQESDLKKYFLLDFYDERRDSVAKYAINIRGDEAFKVRFGKSIMSDYLDSYFTSLFLIMFLGIPVYYCYINLL